MGLTHVAVEVANPARPARRTRVKMLIDSGAAYSIVDRGALRKLGIRPTGTRTFILADGTEVTRSIGAALFRFHGEEGASTVIFGEPGDAALLGVVTLEELGLILDPMRRELRPMPMSLMPLRPCFPVAGRVRKARECAARPVQPPVLVPFAPGDATGGRPAALAADEGAKARAGNQMACASGDRS